MANLKKLSTGLGILPYQLFLFDQEEIWDRKEAEQYKIKELLKTVPEDKQMLFEKILQVVKEWKTE